MSNILDFSTYPSRCYREEDRETECPEGEQLTKDTVIKQLETTSNSFKCKKYQMVFKSDSPKGNSNLVSSKILWELGF